MAALARKRTWRRRHRQYAERSEPEAPRLLLSTIPFIALLALLGVIALSVIVTANPAAQPKHNPPQLAQHEQGVAAKGWFQEAQKEFH